MSHRMHKRARRAARAAMVSAAPLPIILCCGTAMAQQAPAAAPTAQASELQEVVVTGFRASLQTALDEKRNAIQPIESVVEEDIGKMPDQNVAESLQRLPGVSINRSGGKGTQVLIDGLGNNLITLNGEVLLTGREMYVSGEASGGGSGRHSSTPPSKASRARKLAASTSSKIPPRRTARAAWAASSTSRRARRWRRTWA